MRRELVISPTTCRLAMGRRRVIERPRKRTLLLIPAVMLIASCGGESTFEVGTEEGSGGSCAFIVYFRGHAYDARGVEQAPPEGRAIGEARLPGCDDTNDGESEPDEMIPVARLRGASPNVALVWRGSTDTVFVRQGHDPPRAVRRVEDAPPCDGRDAPIDLTGPWLGILGADEKTELDMKPPYDLEMFVEDASTRRYEDVHLTVRVPRSAGEPLTRADVKASLWEGGTIHIEASCDAGRFVAHAADAHPPE